MTMASDQHNLVHMSSDIKETAHSKFHALLRDQIRNEFNASHQYIATAVYFANVDLLQLAKHFYAQAVEERNHAMMIVQYFLDRDITVELNGVDGAKTVFTDAREPIALALAQEETVTEQVVNLASTAREEGDYVGEQFMQWFIKEQVEEVAKMRTLLNVADRAGHNLFDLEEFVAREMNDVAVVGTGAPQAAGGSV